MQPLNEKPTLSVDKMVASYEPPQKLPCISAFTLKVSGTLPEGGSTILPKDMPLFVVLMIVVKSAVKHISPESPIGVQLG